MGFLDEDKMETHNIIHLGYFECINCAHEFDSYTRFRKHLEDTPHFNYFEDSIAKHQEVSSLAKQVYQMPIFENSDVNKKLRIH